MSKKNCTFAPQKFHHSSIIMTAQEALKTYWGYDDFRGIQRDIWKGETSQNTTVSHMLFYLTCS